MSQISYESWFVSARDPASHRALWIRHTRHRPRSGPASVALWCTVVDPDLSGRPIAVKQVLTVLPADSLAGPDRFRGYATMGQRVARWELDVSTHPARQAAQVPLRPLRPTILYRAPLPRTKLEASVPDAVISGTVDINGRRVVVSDWRGTVGHNWGSEHADSWAWIHADSFGADQDAWLELVLARIRVGAARSPWTAMGALSVDGERIPLGGLGRRPRAEVQPGGLVGHVSSPGARLVLSVGSADEDAVTVAYADPSGGHRVVRHAAIATIELTLHRKGSPALALSGTGAYEYGAATGMDGFELEELPDG